MPLGAPVGRMLVWPGVAGREVELGRPLLLHVGGVELRLGHQGAGLVAASLVGVIHITLTVGILLVA